MIAQKKLDNLNKQINEIKEKIRKFQVINNVGNSPVEKHKRLRSPTRKVHRVESILSKTKSTMESRGGLHHSQLDLILGECLFSPLNYSPSISYPKSSKEIFEKVRSLKGQQHSPQDLPYDVEVARKVFVEDILKRKSKNALPHTSSTVSSTESLPHSMMPPASGQGRPVSRAGIRGVPASKADAALPRIKSSRVPSAPAAKAGLTTKKVVADSTTRRKNGGNPVRQRSKENSVGSGGKYSFDSDYDFLFDSKEKKQMGKTTAAFKKDGRTTEPMPRIETRVPSFPRKASFDGASGTVVAPVIEEASKPPRAGDIDSSAASTNRNEPPIAPSDHAQYEDDNFDVVEAESIAAPEQELKNHYFGFEPEEGSSIAYDDEGFDEDSEVTVAVAKQGVVQTAAPLASEESLEEYTEEGFDGDGDGESLGKGKGDPVIATDETEKTARLPPTGRKPSLTVDPGRYSEGITESELLTPVTIGYRKSQRGSAIASTTSSLKTHDMEYYLLSRADYQGSVASEAEADDGNSIGSDPGFSNTLENFIEKQKSSEIMQRMNSQQSIGKA
jgi:hypothetical protein